MSPPWMPLYIADYLADTGHLTTEEHGAYLLLTMHYWRTGGLPQSDDDLATLCRLSAKRWSQIGPKIARLFREGWRHKRIDAELAKAEEKHHKRAEAGKRGGNAKAAVWQCSSIAIANGCQSQSESQGNDISNSLSSAASFPADGAISYTPWSEIARKHGRGADPEVVASAFRDWCRRNDIDFAHPGIERKFTTFCGKHRIRGLHA